MATAVEERLAAQEGSPNRWEARALEQQCACLVALGRVAELEHLLQRSGNSCVRYHLALAYALANRIDAAVEHLRAALKEKPDRAGLKALVFKVALRQADLKLKQQDWNGISSAVALAIEVGPPTPEAARELLRFKSALPVAHIKAGTRQAAEEIWQRELAAQPANRALLHNLAILYYWWALHEEACAGPEVDRLWKAAICYWTRIVRSDAFWAEWKQELQQRWGFTLEAVDLQSLRDNFWEDRLIRIFQNYCSGYKEQSRPQDAERHDDYITAALLERRCCEPTEQEGLALYKSSQGLGGIFILIKERGLPDKALERLAALPAEVRNLADTKYLRVLALYQSAKARQRNSTGEALRQVEIAWSEAQSMPAVPWPPVKDSISNLMVELAKQEAARLKNANQLDEGIALLDRLYKLSGQVGIREYLCILYHDRGMVRINENQWADARVYLQKALDLDKDYTRAKQSMCLAYNNEAMAIEDKERALTLLQKAMEYNPGNTVVRENLAYAFNGKAVKILNTTGATLKEVERAISLLRAAALTATPDVEEKVIDNYIARAGLGFEEEVKKLAEGPYKLILQNLAIGCQRRNAMRR